MSKRLIELNVQRSEIWYPAISTYAIRLPKNAPYIAKYFFPNYFIPTRLQRMSLSVDTNAPRGCGKNFRFLAITPLEGYTRNPCCHFTVDPKTDCLNQHTLIGLCVYPIYWLSG